MQELAELLQNVPGIHSIDLKDVKRLAQLLRETPEIGSIEVKGWFGTGVVITRTTAAPVAAAAPVVVAAAPAAASAADQNREAPPRPASTAPQLKEIRSPMGLRPGQNSRARRSFTTATGSAPSLSVAASARPSRMGSRSVPK